MKEDTRSPEQKAADSDRMAKVRAAKKSSVVIPKEQWEELIAEVEALKRTSAPTPAPTGAVVGAQGVQGVVEKFSVNKSDYPDPTDRLYDEESLRRFALRENFDFEWDVEAVEYEKSGVNYAEPRFIVELWRHHYEDGQRVGRALVGRNYLHEDVTAARHALTKLAMKESDFGSLKEMLDEMRYHRIRMWLLELFNPVPPQPKRRKTTKLIGNKVVEFEDREDVITAAAGQEQAGQVQREVAR